MALVGVLVTFLGFVISVLSLGMATGAGARLVMTLVGIVISLAGIIGMINKAYLKNAIWK